MSGDPRIRTAALGVLAALVAAAPAVVPPASGAASEAGVAETCQGKPATVVTDGTSDAVGTEGDDVIVARTRARAWSVIARGGNDTICVRGGTGFMYVYAEAGDDSVTVEADDGAVIGTNTILGPGDDRYVGGPGRDRVTDWDPNGGDDFQGSALPDSGDDLISTRGGDDVVMAGGRTGPSQIDGIDLGEGADVLQVERSGTTAESRLRGGPGDDHLTLFTIPGRHMGLDLGLRRATLVRSRVLARAWTDFQSWGTAVNVEVDGYEFEDPPAAITVRGSAAADQVSLSTYADYLQPVLLDVALLGGADRLNLHAGVRGAANGGDGRDEIAVSSSGSSSNETTRLDLGAGRLTLAGRSSPLRVARFQDASLSRGLFGGPGVVVGDGDPNRLTGCASLHGAGGNDLLRQAATPGAQCTGFRASGGPGNDRMVGSLRNDVLDGGPGSDTAVGNAGTDTCRAERKASCER